VATKSDQVASELDLQVHRILSRAGVRFAAGPRISGVRPDFLIAFPDGFRVVIEVIGLPFDSEVGRDLKIDQLAMYLRRIGADMGLAVVGSEYPFLEIQRIDRYSPRIRLVSVDRLSAELEALIREHSASERATDESVGIVALVASPQRFEDPAFIRAVSEPAISHGAALRRLDQPTTTPGDIPSLLTGSSMVIADLTDVTPNVMYELGFTRAAGKPAVYIAEDGTKLPSVAIDSPVFFYKHGSMGELSEFLSMQLDQRFGASRVAEQQLNERISQLVSQRFGGYPLSNIERQVLERTLFEAGRNPEITFDYQIVPSGDRWQLRFTPDLGAYGVGADGHNETLKRIADEHARVLRHIRVWDEWREVRSKNY
jgi:hypothetical protein